MKRTIAIGAVLVSALISLGGTAHAEKKKAKAMGRTASGQAYKIDTEKSSIHWTGRKVSGAHNGVIQIKGGEVHVANGAVVGGVVNIDMASITVLDLKDPESNGKLTGHLKSDDFFGVDKFPESKFTITKVEKAEGLEGANAKVTGDLTIKGKANPLTFPAKIDVKDGNLTAQAKGVKVDRTLYGIRYGSGKFTENLGDKMIYDEFLLDFNVTAKK